jgi:two-component system nitrate/nitrite response regulator NarL
MPLRALLVDDNATFLATARTLLEAEGISVVGVAATGDAAAVLACEHHPDVILLDIMLAGESGFRVARRLTWPGHSDAAVILISTHAEADFADLIAASPARGFLPKSEISADGIRRILDEPS